MCQGDKDCNCHERECPVCHERECPGCEIPDDAQIGYYITGSYDERVESGLQAAIERWYERNGGSEDEL